MGKHERLPIFAQRKSHQLWLRKRAALVLLCGFVAAQGVVDFLLVAFAVMCAESALKVTRPKDRKK